MRAAAARSLAWRPATTAASAAPRRPCSARRSLCIALARPAVCASGSSPGHPPSTTRRPPVTLSSCRRWSPPSPPSRASHSVTSFAKLEPSDVAYFLEALDGDETAVVQDAEELAQHNMDWMRIYKGHSQLMLRPSTTAQVSRILTHCNERGLAVVPQGGNTGLVGGSVPLDDEIIVSTSRMNDVLEFDSGSGVLSCGAGCILEALDSWLMDRGYAMPLDLGAKGSCQIGGNVSTNAGGLRLIRYGSLHGNVLGLEVVKADGSVLDLMSSLRKDNVGYDLKQLFIGAEGTLGIVTKVAIQVVPKPAATNVALLACGDFDAVQATLKDAKAALGEVLAAVEFVDRAALETVLAQLEGARDPFTDAQYPFYVLIETRGSRAEHDTDKLDGFLQSVMMGGSVLDGVVAQDGAQAGALWSLRESVGPSLGQAGRVNKYDVSLPLPHMYELVEVTRRRLLDAGRDDATVVGYGHLGDSNLHLNVASSRDSPSLLDLLEPWVFEWTAERKGSISAEHGVGQSKAKYMHLQRSGEVMDLMRQIKAVLDPKGILNPRKVLV